MTIPEIAIKDWTSSTPGSADDVQKFGDPRHAYEDAIIRAYYSVSNLFFDKRFFEDLASVPLEFHGSVTLLGELQNYTNNVFSKYWTTRIRQQNEFAIDILNSFTDLDLSTNKLSEIKDLIFATVANTETSNLLENTVVTRYRSIPAAKLILVENYYKEKIFSLHFESLNYDEALMDSLLDIEIELLERFPTQLFSFHYIPSTSDQIANYRIPDRGKLLFRG